MPINQKVKKDKARKITDEEKKFKVANKMFLSVFHCENEFLECFTLNKYFIGFCYFANRTRQSAAEGVPRKEGPRSGRRRFGWTGEKINVPRDFLFTVIFDCFVDFLAVVSRIKFR